MLLAVKDAILRAENPASPMFSHPILTGFSGKKMLKALQYFCQLFKGQPDVCYVEVGVFQGLTLLSTAGANPEMPCYGIDNFLQLDPEKKNLNTVQERQKTLSIANAHIINQDYEDALLNLGKHIGNKKIAVYFIDGPHDYRSQLVCLLLAKPYLAENAIIVIDDSNYRHVRLANADFLVSHPNFKLVYESYTSKHPQNMTAAQQTEALEGWWDGINIMVRDEQQLLPQMLPTTHRNRELYVNDHIIHSARLSVLAPHLLNAFNFWVKNNWWGALKALSGAFKHYKNRKHEFEGLFDDVNTHSGQIPTKMNQGL